ncbi:Pre-mRNA-splicing factor 38B [Thelohanellus kitauei]|uniref:Pre-mRNA-splicing factor 38 n=1 Tax=Thelohanellus kitauei TaxID=669202 RepID=A0A0C2MT08_THEKT|nr:Pre-mRNA-splicing factor 38B [Thelohanellus kitauei]
MRELTDDQHLVDRVCALAVYMAEWNNTRNPNLALTTPVADQPMKTWGNEKTMNINSLLLSNIQSSLYFKGELAQLACIEELIDQIYYKVTHLEPWEKGTRKTSGQFGMCGGVRGVGAGGVVSSAYCILYKIFLIKPTKSQIKLMLNHRDSPYIRGVGFMFIRYCAPPETLWKWFQRYLDDQEEIDPRANGGRPMTIGTMIRNMLTELDWYGTLFPRIPLQIQKQIDSEIDEHDEQSKKDHRDYKESRTEKHKHKSSERKEKTRKRRSRSRSPNSIGRRRHRNHSPVYKRPRSRSP